MRKFMIPAVVSLLILAVAIWLMMGSDPGELTLDSGGQVGRDSDAEFVDPLTGEEVSGTGADAEGASDNVALSASDGPFLHGRVADEGGRPIGGAQVWVSASQDMFRAQWDRARVFRERMLGREVAGTRGVAADALTDAEGLYSIAISALSPGNYQVLARHEEHVPQWETWTWVPESSEVNFCLGLGDAITGWVLNPDGQRVAGATVEAFVDGGRGRRGPPGMGGQTLADRTQTNEEGRFILGCAGGQFRIVANATGFSRGTTSNVEAGTRDVEVLLAPGRNLAGRVVDEKGEPVAAARISLVQGFDGGGRFGGRGGGFRGPGARMLRIFRGAEQDAVSDDDGRFLFAGLSEGSYALFAEKSGFVPEEETQTIGEELETSEVEMTLQKGSVIDGVVRNLAGDPVRDAFVLVGEDRSDDRGGRGGPMGRGRGRGGPDPGEPEAERRPEPVSVFRATAAAETDARGRFRFDTLEEGQYALSVQSEQFTTFRQDGITLEKEPVKVEVTLDPGITFEGQVLSSRGGDPVPNAKMQFRWGWQDERQARADEEGKFSISGLLPGRMDEVRVDADGFSLLIVNGVEIVPTPVTQEKNFELDPAAVLIGIVTDDRGKPVVNARVSVAESVDTGDQWDRQAWEARRRSFERSTQARTDGEGVFILSEVNPAPAVRLSIEHPDFKEYRSDPFAVQPGDRLEDLQFVLETGARIEAWVRAPDGSPVPRARVVLQQDRSGEQGATEEPGRGGRGGRDGRGGRGSTRSTGPDGKVTFSALDGGNYTATTTVTGYQPAAAHASVGEGEISQAVLDLLPENAITGIVRDSSGNTVSEIWIEASGQEEDASLRGRSFARSSPEGTYRLGSLGAGPYSLRFRGNGFAELRLPEIQVNSEQPVVLQRLGAVSGWVASAETGQPVEQFLLQLATPGEPERQDPRDRFRGGRGNRRAFRDPAGAFTFENVAPGDYSLRVSAEGFSGAEVAVTVAEGLVTEGVQVRLLEGLVLEGLVTLEGSLPVQGAQVFLLPLSEPTGESSEGARDPRERREARRADMEVRRAERRGEDPGTPQPATASLAGASIAAAMRSGRGIATSNEEGAFTLRDLQEGRYLLVVQHDAYVPGKQNLVIAEGRFANPVRVNLKRGEELTGTVQLEDGSPAAGALVVLRDSDGVTKTGRTDASGRYLIRGLVKGGYSFSVRGTDGLRGSGGNVRIESGTNEHDYQQGEGTSGRSR